MKKSKPSKKAKKKSVMKPTLISFLLDETGSMLSCRTATISGFNEYINTLKRDLPKAKFSLFKFDTTGIKTVHSNVPVSDVLELNNQTYTPGDCTNLYDAIGSTVKTTAKEVSKGTSVLFVIMTDGLENSSREFTKEQILTLIKDKEKEGWTFVYLGANQDAWAAATSIGITQNNSINYQHTAKGYAAAFRSLAGQTMCYAAAGSQKTGNFFKGQKEVTEND